MSSGGRTKAARSQKKTGFDNTLINGKTEDKGLSAAEMNIFKRQTNIIEVYEIPTTVPQRHLILTSLEQVLMDLLPARSWEYKKWWCFVWCFISALIGTGGLLWALGKTVLFADQRPSVPRACAVSVLFLPFFCWFKVVFCPHGDTKDMLNAMTEKRTARRALEMKRYLHLEGKLPRPPKEVENPDVPFEYLPEEPWMYTRWKPKPRQYYYTDDDCVAHEAKFGSMEEAREIEKEKTVDVLLKTGVNRDLVTVALEAMADEKEGGEGGGGDEEEGGRRSTMETDDGRSSSVMSAS